MVRPFWIAIEILVVVPSRIFDVLGCALFLQPVETAGQKVGLFACGALRFPFTKPFALYGPAQLGNPNWLGGAVVGAQIAAGGGNGFLHALGPRGFVVWERIGMQAVAAVAGLKFFVQSCVFRYFAEIFLRRPGSD